MQAVNKYKAHKIETCDGVFDSKKEYKRWLVLKAKLESGEISELCRQVSYELIPAQKLPTPIKKGNRTRKTELSCTYKADFVYKQNGMTVVEDTKGFKTKDYIIKRKLMLNRYGIQIKEI